MDSYPQEFLAHPQPLMFVAGLSPDASATAATRDRSASTASANTMRRPSGGSTYAIDAALASADTPNLASSHSLTTPVTSPSHDTNQLPKSPEEEGVPTIQESLAPDEPVDERDRQFLELVGNLRTALSTLGGKGKAWLGPKQRRDFRIILVDKKVRLPMRKVTPTEFSPKPDSSSVSHSPLSPLVPSSPLYPDGLIAPVWVRKHAELVPSVFILFLRLYESPLPPGGLETVEEIQNREARERLEEREMDDFLVKEIGERRRRLGERGIKLTVVLMASSQTLDSPALDPRLSYLRRASALSSKASLFVLSPVPAEELPDFVSSLQEALYDSALEYYAAHTKRVRRKRSRVPTSQPGHLPTTTSTGQKMLGPQGWAVRYDWKLGWFAEVRGEIDAARRHYEDCWNELDKMFSSTTTLPPRSTSWAKAKVLADCVVFRICKLSLYGAEGSRALSSFNVHLKRFGDLSKGWGIGEDTFEFWSWNARQYRIFAELLEMGQSHGLHISTPPPSFPETSATPGHHDPGFYSTPISSSNPTQTLQHPALYYYTAACCTIQRQKRFQEALDAENDATNVEAGQTSGYALSTLPGFANEKKMDHSALIVELFSKAYTLSKDLSGPSNRSALYIAFRIASTYQQSGKYDMAIRFFDRVSHSFKRERWTEIVHKIRQLWYECAKATGEVETVVRLGLEMMCDGSGMSKEERDDVQEELLSLLKTTSPSSTDPIVVEMDGDTELLKVCAVFWRSEATVSQSVPYQVTLWCPGTVVIDSLVFSSLEIDFSDGRPPVMIESVRSPETGGEDMIRVMDTDDKQGLLRWSPGQSLVINGRLSGSVEDEITISKVTLCLQQGPWSIAVVCIPGGSCEWMTEKGGFRDEGLGSSVTFTEQEQRLDWEITHHPSAYVDEVLPIEIRVTNNDERDMDASLSVFLQPGEDGEDDGSVVVAEQQQSSTLIQDIAFPTLKAGSTLSTIVQLCTPPKVATKIIDFSLQTTVQACSASSTSGDGTVSLEKSKETNRTIVIPVLSPFSVDTNVALTHKGSRGGEAVVGMAIMMGGPRGVIVEGVKLVGMGDEKEVRLVASSLDETVFPQVWDQTTSYAIWAVFELVQGHRGAMGHPTQPSAQMEFSWHSEQSGPVVVSRHHLPPLFISPPTDSFLIATLALPSPPSISPHQPFPITLSILNTHPNHPASQVAIRVDTAENFAYAGDRAIQVPVVPPSQGVDITIECVAVGGSGWTRVPKISVWDGEGEDREEIRVRGDTMVLVLP